MGTGIGDDGQDTRRGRSPQQVGRERAWGANSGGRQVDLKSLGRLTIKTIIIPVLGKVAHGDDRICRFEASLMIRGYCLELYRHTN